MGILNFCFIIKSRRKNVLLRQLGYLYKQTLGFASSPHDKFAIFDKKHLHNHEIFKEKRKSQGIAIKYNALGFR